MKDNRASDLLKKFHRQEIDVQQLFLAVKALKNSQLKAFADRLNSSGTMTANSFPGSAGESSCD